jgi:hypothetical protein
MNPDEKSGLDKMQKRLFTGKQAGNSISYRNLQIIKNIYELNPSH